MAMPAGRCYILPMANVLSHVVVPVALGAVTIVLLLGLGNMLRGGHPNISQRLMQLRVLLQAVAIVIVLVTLWTMGR